MAEYVKEPDWCEDCKHFTDVGMDGEGRCDKHNDETWYGEIACSDFERKEDEGDED